MGQRPELNTKLITLATGVDSGAKVYFQPPESIQMTYPCIVYQRNDVLVGFADNNPYMYKKQYQVTVISRSPDCLITDALISFPMCAYDRFYVADNLNHDVFKLYF